MFLHFKFVNFSSETFGQRYLIIRMHDVLKIVAEGQGFQPPPKPIRSTTGRNLNTEMRAQSNLLHHVYTLQK